MSLPSEISFVSFLQYSPRGGSAISKQSKTACLAIKGDHALLFRRSDGTRAIQNAIGGIVSMIPLKLEGFSFLRNVLSQDRVLVPVPRSAPLQSHALWPTKRICDELVAIGLGKTVVPALVRQTAVRKSATAPPGERDDATATLRECQCRPRVTLRRHVSNHAS